MSKTNLVIVESTAKAKTIGKYLGAGYKVTSTMGHIRDLPKSVIGVDIEGGFVPQYQPIKGKEATVAALKKEIKNSEKVFLATAPDREGEAISWHLKEMLGLSDEKACRVTFNEITKKVVTESVKQPRANEQSLVDAQQARRILDRIVGYQLSPLLWRKVRTGLSAGRVQSVATRLVVEREEEINAFVSREYWTMDVTLERIAPNSGSFVARYYGRNGKKCDEFESSEDAQRVKAALREAQFMVSAVKRAEKRRQPAPPFTTSTLQQEASRKLNMAPRRTMSAAQQLYEGVDIDGQGTVGLITYMRTDSLRLSDDALNAAKDYILANYGAAFYPEQTRRFKSKSNAQDAHEAIRPTDINLTPDVVRKSLTSDQYRLYRLIWSRFLACQMAAAVYDTLSIDISAAEHLFRASHTAMKFAGYTVAYDNTQEDDNGQRNSPLPDLSEGEVLRLAGADEAQHFTQPPARYSEATLIRALEEKGIGRPSTYAPTISTIQSRNYVIKEGKALRPTALGVTVTKLMTDYFPDVADPTFTAQLEQQLDDVETGKTEWHALLAQFYEGFSAELEQTEKALDGKRIKIPVEESDELCDVCGKRMVFKTGRFGRFLACPGYPECTFTKPIVIEMPGKCPRCGSRILKKTSRNGHTYYGCERNRVAERIECEFMTWDVPVEECCQECGMTMFKLSGKGFKKPFCINEKCTQFLPEERRGYVKRKTTAQAQTDAQTPQSGEQTEPTEKTAKKATTTKTTAKKATATKKATAAKKTTARKTATTKKTRGGEE